MANTFQPKTDNSVIAPRSRKNLSFNWLGTADFGRLVPFHWQELLESDKIITCRPNLELQMLPLASPTFGEMDIYIHYFYVPFRQLWPDFSDWHSQSGPGSQSTMPYWTPNDFRLFYANSEQISKRALFKHFTSLGLPPFFASGTGSTLPDADSDRLYTLPLRAYDKIWWDFYRDPEVLPDSDYNLYNRTNSGHDSATVSNLTYYPKKRNIKDVWWSELFATNGTLLNSAVFDLASSSQNPGLAYNGSSGSISNTLRFDRNGNVGNVVNPSDSFLSGSNSSIAQTDSENLRKLEALTRMAERLSLSGKRSIDRLFAQYGVVPNFEKMKLCEYVGGAKASVLVSDITASATTDVSVDTRGSVLGQKGGSGYAQLSNLNIKYHAHEPGILMGILSIMPKIHFVQGLSKKWYRNNLDDFFRKELQHVGQVAVSRNEVATSYAANGQFQNYDPTKDKETFAFAAPYYEYGFNHDVLAGDFMYYHNTPHTDPSYENDLSYMQSMGIYADYPEGRQFDAESLQVRSTDANQIFYYLGGDIWEDVDDHFHININLKCVADRPMDGAAPTLETDDQPHQGSAPIQQSTEL